MTMDIQPTPIEYKREHGRSLWQPALSDGTRLFHFYNYAGDWYEWCTPLEASSDPSSCEPYLRRFRTAARISRRAIRNWARTEYTEVSP